MIINGYSVVSLPELNYSEDTEVELFRNAPQVNGIYYAGYQRNEFGEMDKLYRTGSLPLEIKKMYSQVLNNQNKGLYDYYVTGSYEEAISIVSYMKSIGENLEVIGLNSRNIEKHLGTQEFTGNAVLLGYDINADGYSVILTCFFEKNDLFCDELKLMNENGLLKDVASVSVLINKYINIQDNENIEKISKDSIDVIAVYEIEGGVTT